jgi:uncharacterized protein YegJ (DUF2314 family)
MVGSAVFFQLRQEYRRQNAELPRFGSAGVSMSTRLKQILGLVAIVVGLPMLGYGLAHWLLAEEPFQLTTFIGGSVLGLLFLSFGRKWLFNLISLDVIAVESDSPEIKKAAQRARSTIGQLWDYLAQNRHECYVKFPLKTKSGSCEHIWGVVHSRVEGGVVVSLANAPVENPDNTNDRMVVSEDDIEDWQVFISESEIRGGYSIAALAQIARARGGRLSRSDRRKLEVFVDVDLG